MLNGEVAKYYGGCNKTYVKLETCTYCIIILGVALCLICSKCLDGELVTTDTCGKLATCT